MVVIVERPFLCGVVEGFYGRPWTCDQRRELYCRMQRSGMNTYIYAPKDDIKHRALWRQPYTKEEEIKLKALIDAATNEGITFVYAISPGLDISFSLAGDISILKRKMKQVSKLGCKAFALLFDDINPTLKPHDAAVFSSSAQAQASLTNELFSHMKERQFLFCPTEYCKTRALPTVKTSEYLNTLGKELHPDIDIMWTGDKVIPELITKDSIKELGEVLKRKPVIWDNIHANDYDQRRVFLGGYNGRPIELYPYLNGILTNPNCEFEANFIAIHTLGTWCRIASSVQESSTFDVQMVDLSDVSPPETPTVPDADCEMPEDLLPSLTAADVSAVISVYNYNDALKLALQEWLLEFNMNKKAPLKSYSKRNLKATKTINGQTVLAAVPYELDIAADTEETIITMKEDKLKCMMLTQENLQSLTEMFCLPYEHGEKGNKLLEDFEWLLENAADIYEQPPSKEKISRWFDRLLMCDKKCKEVYDLFKSFCKIPNEAILYDLYPYIWDLKEVVSALDSYVHWLSDSITTNMSFEQVKKSHGGLNLALNKLPLLNEYIEPWHVRYIGGLTGALHRILPFQGGYVYLAHPPDIPSNVVLRTRAYSSVDRENLYQFIRSKKDAALETIQNDIDYELEVGVFTKTCPKNLFIIEDDKEVCGFVAAIPDNRKFIQQVAEQWLPEFKAKYQEHKSEIVLHNMAEIEDWKLATASHLVLKVDSKVHSECAVKRIINSALSVLKTSGATTVFHRIENDSDFELLVELGFFPVSEVETKLLWRSL